MSAPSTPTKPLRVAIIHPDLGIGGAERLIVDAAVGLQKIGHFVDIFTSHHDPSHCFSETRDGTLNVHVLGSTLPRSLGGSLHIIFAILRQLHLTFLLLFSLYLPRFSSPPPFFRKWYLPAKGYDVVLVDQLSSCIPFVRWFAQTRVVFYCHFPDKLLSGGKAAAVAEDGSKVLDGGSRGGLLKALYRLPVDMWEEVTTGESDVIVANSIFTSNVFSHSFKSINKQTQVVYPGIDLASYPTSTPSSDDPAVGLIQSDRPTFLSLNRFEPKKNVQLAVEALAELVEREPNNANLRLVVAGGYDPRLPSNVDNLSHLQSLCDSLHLSHHTLASSTSPAPPPTAQVVFLLNYTTPQRQALLTSPSTLLLLYTPTNEHFGIVPVEAMASGLPVLATRSGGPCESIADGETGYLRESDSHVWAQAMGHVLRLGTDERRAMGVQGRKRVDEKFTLEKTTEGLEHVLRFAVGMGSPGLEDGLLKLVGAVVLATAMVISISGALYLAQLNNP